MFFFNLYDVYFSWLEKGADVNAPDKNGNYAIHLAAEKGFRYIFFYFLDHLKRTGTDRGLTLVIIEPLNHESIFKTMFL